MYHGSRGQKRKYSSKGSSFKGNKRYKGASSGSTIGARAAGNLGRRFSNYPTQYAVINRGPAYIPDCYYTKLKFNLTLSFSTTAGLATYAGIRGSGVGDPTGSLGSTRPPGASELDALYNRWTVLGSKCSIKISQNSPANDSSTHVLIPYPNPANPYTSTDVVRTGGSPYGKIATASYYNGPKTIMQNYMSTAKIFGISRSRVVDDPNYGGTGNTDPSFYFLWVIGAQGDNPAVAVSGWYQVQLTYYVKYWQRLFPL